LQTVKDSDLLDEKEKKKVAENTHILFVPINALTPFFFAVMTFQVLIKILLNPLYFSPKLHII